MIENVDLKERYKRLNREIFSLQKPPVSENGMEPGKVEVKWSSRMTSSAGVCKRRGNKVLIALSTHYHEKFPEEINNTLVHEMIHIDVRGHGLEFERACRLVNALDARLDVRKHALENAIVRYIYKCNKCGAEITAARKWKYPLYEYHCTKCGGEFDMYETDE